MGENAFSLKFSRPGSDSGVNPEGKNAFSRSFGSVYPAWMLVHVVLFWLKKELSASERAAFVEGLESLRGIPVVSSLHIGTPAATPQRPVTDGSYDYMLTVVLPSLASHDAYQADPLHEAFLAQNRECWDKVVVYDADCSRKE